MEMNTTVSCSRVSALRAAFRWVISACSHVLGREWSGMRGEGAVEQQIEEKMVMLNISTSTELAHTARDFFSFSPTCLWFHPMYYSAALPRFLFIPALHVFRFACFKTTHSVWTKWNYTNIERLSTCNSHFVDQRGTGSLFVIQRFSRSFSASFFVRVSLFRILASALCTVDQQPCSNILCAQIQIGLSSLCVASTAELCWISCLKYKRMFYRSHRLRCAETLVVYEAL